MFQQNDLDVISIIENNQFKILNKTTKMPYMNGPVQSFKISDYDISTPEHAYALQIRL